MGTLGGASRGVVMGTLGECLMGLWGGKTYFGDVMGLEEAWGCGHKGRHVEKRI